MQNAIGRIVALDGISHDTFHALAALLAMHFFLMHFPEEISNADHARAAFDMADAMVEERKKRMGDPS